MKNSILYKALLVLVISVALSLSGHAQCTPMDPEDCPDPENNGQVCPDTMPVGYLNQAYAEEATILVPEQYLNAQIHNLTIVDISNLPPGISWQSNAPDNRLLAGNYYCMVLEGTPTIADTFYLKIIIDVYLDIIGQPVFFAQIVDSTSLAMIINEDFSIAEQERPLNLLGSFPNPFSDRTNIRFYVPEGGTATFELYNALGRMMHADEVAVHRGENTIPFNGSHLPAGTYFYLIRQEGKYRSASFIRRDH